MLSPSDKTFLDANAYSIDHDYFYLPRLLGEPFLNDGILSFFDGSSVHIMGAAIPWHPLNAQQNIASVVERWVRDKRVEFINYFGPIRPNLALTQNFVIEYSEDSSDHNVELFVDLSVTRSLKIARRQRQDLARARRRGIEVRNTKIVHFSHLHISLLRNSLQRSDYGLSDASYVLNLSSVLNHPSTIVFEAMIGNHLVGIGITYEFFRGRPFFLAAAFDRGTPGCSDAIYGAIIRYYRDVGAKTLSLGYTSSLENMHYKTKWGGAPHVPPWCQIILRSRDCRTPFRESLHWPWCILADAWCATPL